MPCNKCTIIWIIPFVILGCITAFVIFLYPPSAGEDVSNKIAKGTSVEMIGQVSNTPWQHMIDIQEDYPHMEYIDFDDDQLVVYSKEPIDCEEKVRLKGVVIEIKGSAKRPGSDEIYTELQITVDEFECM